MRIIHDTALNFKMLCVPYQDFCINRGFRGASPAAQRFLSSQQLTNAA